jgi:hypothetical protein
MSAVNSACAVWNACLLLKLLHCLLKCSSSREFDDLIEQSVINEQRNCPAAHVMHI